MTDDFFDGFNLLEKDINEYLKDLSEEKVIDVLTVGAKQFVEVLLKLPKPMSEIRKAGYTHLVNTFNYKQVKNQVDVGWGKYYGPMVERGSIKNHAQPHLMPAWEKNKDEINKKMIEKIWRK